MNKYAGGAIAVLSLLGMIGGVAFLGTMYTQGSIDGPQTPADNSQKDKTSGDDKKSFDGRWKGRAVKKDVKLKDLTSSAIKSGTIHIFKQKPTDSNGNEVWNAPRQIEAYFGTSQEYDQVSVSSGTTTVQYEPGQYHAVLESSGRYYEFVSFIIPDGSDLPESTTLSDYNQAPEMVTFEMANKSSPSFSAIDLGVSSNSSSIDEYSADTTVKPDDSEEYRVWKAVAYTGAVDPTTDSNDNGDYDEGIQKIRFEASGACTADKTLFEPGSGIDDLGDSDGKAEVDLDCTATSNDPLTVTAHVVTFATEDGTKSADGDEQLSDGENPVDLQLFRSDGTGQGKFDVTA